MNHLNNRPDFVLQSFLPFNHTPGKHIPHFQMFMKFSRSCTFCMVRSCSLTPSHLHILGQSVPSHLQHGSASPCLPDLFSTIFFKEAFLPGVARIWARSATWTWTWATPSGSRPLGSLSNTSKAWFKVFCTEICISLCNFAGLFGNFKFLTIIWQWKALNRKKRRL